MIFTKTYDLPSVDASEAFAIHIADALSVPFVMTFSGEIGRGKTTIIRAMLRYLGVTSRIKSPTFSLVESYEVNDLQIHHFDLYRIKDESELEEIGFADYFSQDAILCIEWPEHAGQCLHLVDLKFALDVKGPGRLLHIEATSPRGVETISSLIGEQ
jgi:tRNA threonylcarbamoyladenosine biosynthesis protein TsaE